MFTSDNYNINHFIKRKIKTNINDEQIDQYIEYARTQLREYK